MVKRKSRRATMKRPKKPMKLDTLFSCPFCGHADSVECTIDGKDWIGEASCRVCEELYFTTTTALTEPVDIYHEWFDECERANDSER